jgi:hypothetical protein
MDILNWIYLKTNELIRPTANNTNTDIIALGANVGPIQRGDSYQTYAMTIQDFADTIATLLPPAPPASTGLFTQTANGPTVTNTVTESTVIGTGIGSLTVPANAFQVGDSFAVNIMGHISAKNNNTIRIRVKTGSVVLGDTGVITLPNITSKHYDISLNFTIRTLGAAGVASIASGGQFTYSKNASNAFEGSDFSIINNTTFDTTIANTLNITVEWGTADPLNSIYTEILTLYKTY